VTGAAVVNDLPAQGGTNGGVKVEGRNYTDDTSPVADKRFASTDYFRTIGARIIEGRDFNNGDVMNANHVTIVNKAFADKVFPGESAIGKRIEFGWGTTGFQAIVGVVGNVKEQPLGEEMTPSTYLPLDQRTETVMSLVVRSSVDELSLVPAIRRELRGLDAAVPLDEVKPLTEVVSTGVASQRLTTVLLTLFSVAALLLAAIGLYGVISYSVVQRTQELGIRTALGAQRSTLVAGVIREGFAFVIAGMVIGGLVARASATVIASQLFGVTAGDALVYASVAGLLAVVSLIALWAPAVRASRVDPMTALREE
jgi:predicted permease